MQATLAQHGYNTRTAQSKQKTSIESVDTPCFGDLLREQEKIPGTITMAKFIAMLKEPASPVKNLETENEPTPQGTPPDSPSKLPASALPKFGFWLSEKQIKLLTDCLDPMGYSKKTKDLELSTVDLIRMFERAECNVHQVKISTVRFALVILDALEIFLSDQVPLSITHNATKIMFPSVRDA